jgi:hypothetical protein
LVIALRLHAEEPARTIEGLNLLGGSAITPQVADTLPVTVTWGLYL